MPIRGLHGAFNLFIKFDDLQPPDFQVGGGVRPSAVTLMDGWRKASCRSAMNRYPADPTRLLKVSPVQTEGSVAASFQRANVYEPLSHLMKSNVF